MDNQQNRISNAVQCLKGVIIESARGNVSTEQGGFIWLLILASVPSLWEYRVPF